MAERTWQETYRSLNRQLGEFADREETLQATCGRLYDDLTACRERLAALVAAWTTHGSITAEADAARRWLAAHPAEGGQDD